MKDLDNILTFTCTDRLGESKQLEFALNQKNSENSTKTDKEKILENNRTLIDSLNEFQININTLMTGFVEKEKQAVLSKRLSNEHLKKENLKSDENESENDNSGSEEDVEEVAEGDSSLKRQHDGKLKNEDVSSEKKSCS